VHWISVHHFHGPAFSSPAIWSVIFQVLHFQSTPDDLDRDARGQNFRRISWITLVLFGIERPNSILQDNTRGEGAYFYGSATSLPQRGRCRSAPQFLWFPFYLCLHPLSQYYQIGRGNIWGGAYFRGSATPPIPRERSSPIFSILLYLCQHPLTQNDQIRHGTYGEAFVLGGQPRHCICTNASRGFLLMLMSSVKCKCSSYAASFTSYVLLNLLKVQTVLQLSTFQYGRSTCWSQFEPQIPLGD